MVVAVRGGELVKNRRGEKRSDDRTTPRGMEWSNGGISRLTST